MKYQNKITVIVLIFCIANVISITNVQGHESGVSDPYIPLPNALRNTTYQKLIWIYNTGNNYTSEIYLDSIGEIKDWITFYEYDNATNPINSTLIPKLTDKRILINISIPQDAANKEYTGNIEVLYKPDLTNISDANVSSVYQGMGIILSINVTGDEILNVTVNRIKIEDVEIYYNAEIIVDFQNIGNVRASPKVEIVFNKDGQYVGNLSSTSDSFSPGDIKEHKMEWDTSELVRSGTYNAFFNITLKGKIVKKQNVSFEVLPQGTLLRDGTLEKITCTGEYEKEKPLTIVATFGNTGQIETEAQFFGKIYRNGKQVETIESQKENVDKNKQQFLTIHYTPDKDGSYEIKGYVTYSDIHSSEWKTDTLALKFTIGESLSFDITQILMVLSLIAVIAIVLLIYVLQKKSIINIEIKKRSSLAKTYSSTIPKKQKTINNNKSNRQAKKVSAIEKIKTKKIKAKNHRKKTRKRIRIRRDKSKSPLRSLSKNKKGKGQKTKERSKEANIEKKIDKLVTPKSNDKK